MKRLKLMYVVLSHIVNNEPAEIILKIAEVLKIKLED